MSIQARPLSFADQVCQHNKKPTKLKRMLDEMEKVIPWDKIMAIFTLCCRWRGIAVVAVKTLAVVEHHDVVYIAAEVRQRVGSYPTWKVLFSNVRRSSLPPHCPSNCHDGSCCQRCHGH